MRRCGFSCELRWVPACVLVVGLFSVRSAVVADVVQIVATQDNTLYEESRSFSNGAGQHFFAGTTGFTTSMSVRRSLVAFDLAGVIPPGALINSVSLTLHMSRTLSGPVVIEVRRSEAAWGQGASRAGNQGNREGGGVQAEIGDATWSHRFWDTDTWSTPGGDFAGVSATASVGAAGTYTWATTPRLVADVQSWLDDPGTNFGWLLKAADEGVGFSAKQFDSREHPAADRRPTITVDFTPPVLEPVFRRGDANVDGNVDVSDIVAVLEALFGAAGQPACLDSIDGNDDGFIDVSDAVAVTLEIFAAFLVPTPGSVSCGVDPTQDELDCAAYDASCA